MIDIEMLTALMKELGYLDDSDEDGEKKDHPEDKSTQKPEQKEKE